MRTCASPLTLIAVGQVVEIRVKMCWLAAQCLRQALAEWLERGSEFIVVAGHFGSQWLRLGDGHERELPRSQPHRGVPAAVSGIYADSDEKAVHVLWVGAPEPDPAGGGGKSCVAKCPPIRRITSTNCFTSSALI